MKQKFRRVFVGAILPAGLLFIFFISCSRSVTGEAAIVMHWHPLDDINAQLPAGITAFAGQNEHVPLKAWYVRVQESRPEIVTRVLVSDDSSDNRETVSSFARDEGAVVVLNAGYFVMGRTPALHAGLLVCDGRIVAPATRKVVREKVRYPTVRSAVGFTPDDRVEITWAGTRHDTLFSWDNPVPQKPHKPVPLNFSEARVWQVRDAVGAGPMLVVNGKISVTTDQEVFFGSAIPNVHPRSAVGVTREGDLILMVVDGRQPESRGVNLEELADLMLRVGAEQAMNLDGGGSSALVVNGVLLNRPAGDEVEREVMSVLATFAEKRD